MSGCKFPVCPGSCSNRLTVRRCLRDDFTQSSALEAQWTAVRSHGVGTRVLPFVPAKNGGEQVPYLR
jgi:hypothetical protein